MELSAKPFYLNEEQILKINRLQQSMTTDEKLEQLFCPLLFTNDPNALKAIISQNKFGAFMFRDGNEKEIQTAINTLQEHSTIPLLIAANLEDGGNGIAEKGTYVGRQMLIAATNKEEMAEKLGNVCASEGNAVGINWTFSPVIDIDYNFRNPITNVRTFGSDENKVLNMSKAYIKGINKENMVYTLKHFPGDGIDERDQHLVTSVNTLSVEAWEKSYGLLYATLIEDGAKVVMAGHIAMPALEELYNGKPCNEVIPATLSKNIIQKHLREKMNFNGLVVTDASPMVGFTSVSERESAVPLAIENGCDMFLFTRDLDEDLNYMKKGYQNGILGERRLNEAVTKILALKASIGLLDENAQIRRNEAELSHVGNEKHISWAKEAADYGVTLVKDTQHLLPLNAKRTKRVLLEMLGDFHSNDRVYNQFEALLVNEGFEVTKYIPETIQIIFAEASVEKFKAKYDLIMYIGNIENASNKTVSRIHWHTLFGAGNNLPWFAKEIPTLFVSVGNPYHLLDVPMIKTYINGYCHSPYVIESIMEKLMGRSEFKGVNPIDPFCGLWDTRL